MIDRPAYRLLGAWITTAIVDGLFSSVLAAFFYDSTVTRLWQGVAVVPFGKSALEGGTRTALTGVLLHFGVAFGWSAVFLILAMRSASIRNLLASRSGIVTAAVVFGPCVWLVMSLAVIPLLAHRPPSITIRWWIQLIGHAPFVGLPTAAWIGSGVKRNSPSSHY